VLQCCVLAQQVISIWRQPVSDIILALRLHALLRRKTNCKAILNTAERSVITGGLKTNTNKEATTRIHATSRLFPTTVL
jgi:hypothetical protein